MRLRNGEIVDRELIERMARELADMTANTIGAQEAPDWDEIRNYTEFRVSRVEEFASRYDSDAAEWFDRGIRRPDSGSGQRAVRIGRIAMDRETLTTKIEELDAIRWELQEELLGAIEHKPMALVIFDWATVTDEFEINPKILRVDDECAEAICERLREYRALYFDVQRSVNDPDDRRRPRTQVTHHDGPDVAIAALRLWRRLECSLGAFYANWVFRLAMDISVPVNLAQTTLEMLMPQSRCRSTLYSTASPCVDDAAGREEAVSMIHSLRSAMSAVDVGPDSLAFQ